MVQEETLEKGCQKPEQYHKLLIERWLADLYDEFILSLTWVLENFEAGQH